MNNQKKFGAYVFRIVVVLSLIALAGAHLYSIPTRARSTEMATVGRVVTMRQVLPGPSGLPALKAIKYGRQMPTETARRRSCTNLRQPIKKVPPDLILTR